MGGGGGGGGGGYVVVDVGCGVAEGVVVVGWWRLVGWWWRWGVGVGWGWGWWWVGWVWRWVGVWGGSGWGWWVAVGGEWRWVAALGGAGCGWWWRWGCFTWNIRIMIALLVQQPTTFDVISAVFVYVRSQIYHCIRTNDLNPNRLKQVSYTILMFQ